MQKRIKTLQQQLQTQQDEMIIISTELRVANTRNISLENELRDKAETMTIKEHTDASLANKLELAERTIEEFLRR